MVEQRSRSYRQLCNEIDSRRTDGRTEAEKETPAGWLARLTEEIRQLDIAKPTLHNYHLLSPRPASPPPLHCTHTSTIRSAYLSVCVYFADSLYQSVSVRLHYLLIQRSQYTFHLHFLDR